MKYTGERLDPESARTSQEQVTVALHRFAYVVAAEYAEGAGRLLDVGFGDGYGSTIVGPVVGRYVGVEIREDVVAHAVDRYGAPSTEFLLYDGVSLPFDAASFDVTLSFQVIEHVDDSRRFLLEARRVTRPGGLVLITTPNRAHRVRDGERPWNRYHVREYNSSELAELMGSVFGDFELFGVHGTPTVEAIERDRVARARRYARLDPLGLRYALPESLAVRVRAALMRPRRRTSAHRSDPIGVDQISRAADRVEESLDLLAVARVA
jgi:SAM-dependent methyltransferase